jgi:hypothetical protein
MHNTSEQVDRFGLPEGFIAALTGALLSLGAFVGFTAALTTCAILALAVTLPGCSAIADAIGRTIRRDWRAYASILAATPILCAAYATAVRALTVIALINAILIVLVPAVVLWRSRSARRLTLLDGVGLAYLWLVSASSLWPPLTLPVIGGRVGVLRWP